MQNLKLSAPTESPSGTVSPSSTLSPTVSTTAKTALCSFAHSTDITSIVAQGWRCNARDQPLTNVCRWKGVKCDYHGNVVQFFPSGLNLTGTLPADLDLLTDCYSIVLFSNQLAGTIPSTLGQLSGKLNTLHLAANKLTGTIPSSLGNISSLSNLFLFQNRLRGTIPESLGELTQLTQLDLSNNDLSGAVPDSLCQLKQLKVLSLSNNTRLACYPQCLSTVPTQDYDGMPVC